MARFLLCSLPLVGHLGPGIPIARALVARGHEVHWYTGRQFRAQIEAAGATHEPMAVAPDDAEADLRRRHPEWAASTGLAAIKIGIKHLFLDSAPWQVADLRRILAAFPADVLVSDAAFTGGRALHQLGGPPCAIYGVAPLSVASRDTAPFGLGIPPLDSPLGRLRNRMLYALLNRVLFRDVNRYYNRVRAEVGLPATRASVFDDAVAVPLFIQGTVPSFEYPRRDLPPQIHFVGPFLPGPSANFAPPPWWGDLLGSRWVVHVTQGTVATDADELLVPTLRALAHEDVLVVATTGGKPVESVEIEQLPANARLASFIPHYHLLPHVDAVVTNGGYGGVQIALANGVPLVAAGRTQEKPEVCARVAWSGAGIDLKTNRPKSAQIRTAVRAVLDKPRYRRQALRIAGDMARHDAPTEAAILLEQLAAGSAGQATAPRP